MKRWLWVLVTGWAGMAAAQQTPEAAADALWRTLSHGPGAGADREALRQLFLPEAQVYGLADRDGRRALRRRSAAEFIEAQASPGAQGFHETEIHREVRRYADFAEVFATVESRTDPAAAAADFTGINSLHLVEQDGRWRIIGLYYVLERPGQPLPAAWRGKP
jgi:Putative lumazine-binding